MKKQITILTLIFATLFANTQNIIAPAIIDNNTTWNADTVFLNSDVDIINGKTLTIEPGVVIIANAWYGIKCQGQILAEGTEQDSILFTIADTTGFSNTDTTLGGWKGINFVNTPSTNDSSIFNYCIMNYGKGGGLSEKTKYGGLFYILSFNKLRISNSILSMNYAERGGAIYTSNSTTIIEKNIIKNNLAIDAGALYIKGYSKSLIYKNIFISNHAIAKYDFGDGYIVDQKISCIIIYKPVMDANISPVKIISNEFYNHASFNGVVYDNAHNSVIINNLFCNNKDRILMCAVSISKSKYLNNIFVNNDIKQISTISLFTSTIFANNIIIRNLNGGLEDKQLIYCESNVLLENYSSIQYNYIQYGDIYNIEGHDNIMGNSPQFVFPSNSMGYVNNWQDYDWSLQPTSPCINAGRIDTTGLDLPEEDAFGNPRIFGGRIDIGAYENQTEVWNNIFSLDENMQITYYPNPVQNNLNIKIKSKELRNKNLEIYDINGKLLKTIEIASSQTPRNDVIIINVSDLETGVYYLRVEGLSKEFIKL